MLLAASPLECVEAYHSIEQVILAGQLIEREPLAADHRSLPGHFGCDSGESVTGAAPQGSTDGEAERQEVRQFLDLAGSRP